MNDDIGNVGFLADATPALKDLMRRLAKRTTLDAGEVLLHQGMQGQTLYAVISGRLEASVLSADGRKLGLSIMHPGEVFGEIALFNPGPRTATVTAMEPSQVLGVRNADVLAALRDKKDLNIDLLQLAGQRMRLMGSQLSDQVFLPIPQRLARKILQLTDEFKGPNEILRLSQTELADFIGASREAVSKALAVWKKDQTIQLSRGGLKVINRTALEICAEIENFSA